RLKILLNQTSQRQLINRDKQVTQKRILFSVIFSMSGSKRFIIVTCIAYTIRVLVHYMHISLAKYVFLTQNELKQLGLYIP
ncbi:unnamed protein product, partial [Adineta steineri]